MGQKLADSIKVNIRIFNARLNFHLNELKIFHDLNKIHIIIYIHVYVLLMNYVLMRF